MTNRNCYQSTTGHKIKMKQYEYHDNFKYYEHNEQYKPT